MSIPTRALKTALGTASVGMEFIDQIHAASAALDAVIVAAGGGGLTGGVACAVKQMSPGTAVYVVEPEGADSMSRSFKAGSPQAIDAVRTIADSLGAPRCEPYSFALNRRFVDEVVLVNDDQIPDGMRLLFRAAKLAVEPAGAAALAALMYPLHTRLKGKSVGIVVCGANIDAAFCETVVAVTFIICRGTPFRAAYQTLSPETPHQFLSFVSSKCRVGKA